MADDYTPDMETVAIRYVIASLCDEEDRPLARAEFDRFIASVKAEVLREVADECDVHAASSWDVLAWLRDRANAIEKGAGDE